MELELRDDRILVRPVFPELSTKSGIILPETIQNEEPQEGIVEKLGPGKLLKTGEREPIGIQVGDKVVYVRFAGRSIDLEDEEVKLLILHEEDILAVIDGKVS